MKILVADDDECIRACLSDMLRAEGYEVVEAEDGDKEWKILHLDCDIDVVVSDDKMPFRTGSDVIKTLKEENGRTIKTILVSANCDIGRIALECHADAWLEKPYSMASLREKINQVFYTK
ncbi:response regulator [Candidatus Giovannonibacteria bacterium]|nr:response regulator [Candidatus Giovannonibacteria bacterium]